MILSRQCPALSQSEVGFNYYLSSHRMHIKQAFSIMMARWGIIWRPLRFALCLDVVLHSYCLDHYDQPLQDMMPELDYTRVKPNIQQLFIFNGGSTTRNKRSSKRNAVLQMIHEQGIRRPHVD